MNLFTPILYLIFIIRTVASLRGKCNQLMTSVLTQKNNTRGYIFIFGIILEILAMREKGDKSTYYEYLSQFLVGEINIGNIRLSKSHVQFLIKSIDNQHAKTYSAPFSFLIIWKFISQVLHLKWKMAERSMEHQILWWNPMQLLEKPCSKYREGRIKAIKWVLASLKSWS